jgi:hypothetical protein
MSPPSLRLKSKPRKKKSMKEAASKVFLLRTRIIFSTPPANVRFTGRTDLLVD